MKMNFMRLMIVGLIVISGLSQHTTVVAGSGKYFAAGLGGAALGGMIARGRSDRRYYRDQAAYQQARADQAEWELRNRRLPTTRQVYVQDADYDGYNE